MVVINIIVGVYLVNMTKKSIDCVLSRPEQMWVEQWEGKVALPAFVLEEYNLIRRDWMPENKMCFLCPCVFHYCEKGVIRNRTARNRTQGLTMNNEMIFELLERFCVGTVQFQAVLLHAVLYRHR
uniref:Uncharacterized protein n=1 Tax=Caenorhabditis japonica TaxID=281687 RepID=A0A8R1EBH7_CAEJA